MSRTGETCGAARWLLGPALVFSLALLVGAEQALAQICPPRDPDCSQGCTDDNDCNDNNVCNGVETCVSGFCVRGTPVVCTASDQCHDVGTCNPATGVCDNPAKANGAPCNDGNACTQTDTCQGGACTGGNPVVCTASDQCHEAGTCDPATGVCDNPGKPDTTPCDDGEACTEDDTCLAGVCTPGENACPTICRSPGFFANHAGTEKRHSQNITQALLTAGGGCLEICGEVIKTTAVHDADSAEEALCLRDHAPRELRLARHLLATAFNCTLSNGHPTCAGLTYGDVDIGALFAECNASCPAGDPAAIRLCRKRLACFNGGGVPLATGFCQTGICSDNQAPCRGGEDEDDDEEGDLSACGNPHTATCLPFLDTCHEEPLVNDLLGFDFEPPGRAGSPKACKSARKTACTVLPPGEAACEAGTMLAGTETCP